MSRDISKKFHFIEIDWIIYFPSKGNKGRPIKKYGVAYLNRKTGETQKGRRINLEDVISLHEIKDKYPHTVGFYLKSYGKAMSFSPQYLEKQIVKNENDLYDWIKSKVS